MYKRDKYSPAIQLGFTIIELIVVIAIIVTLLVIGMVSFTSSQNRSKKESAIAVADKVKLNLGSYFNEKDRYPANQTGATSVVSYITAKGDSATALDFSNTTKFTYSPTTATGTSCSDTGASKCDKYVITIKKETWSGDTDITVKP